MPTFCRHNRLVQNCPICAREQDVEMRPVVTPGGRPEPRPRTDGPRAAPRSSSRSATSRSSPRSAGGMTVRRLVREADDGYVCDLIPGVHSEAAARRLAEELAFAATRLAGLPVDPPGLYREVADPAVDLEERSWLALQIAVLGPLDPADAADPFEAIDEVRTSWASGDTPALDGIRFGPRGIGDPARAQRAMAAYRGWVRRQGSQAAGLSGDDAWTPERRFDRVFERLGTLAGMERGAGYDLLATLGRLEVYALRGSRLHVGGSDAVTLAAKRLLGIGDPLLLERRAADLAAACELPVEALDLGFFNWERGSRATQGLPADAPVDAARQTAALAALGLS